MKAAEEIIKTRFYPYSGWRYDHEELVGIVKSIQKDAELTGWKRGMTEAAEITQHNQNFDNSIPEIVMIQSQIYLKKAILSKRDEKGGNVKGNK